MRTWIGLTLALHLMATSAAEADATPVTTAAAPLASRPGFADWVAGRQQSAAGLTPRGLAPETPETGEVGAWKIPVPELNPLGAQRLYDLGTGYRAEGNMRLACLDRLTEVRRVLSGESWSLSFRTKGGDVLPFMRDYATRMGADVLASGSDDGLALRLTKQGSVWWCDVDASAPGRVDLRVLKQKVLAVNEELRITKDMFGKDGTFRFLADVPGRKLVLVRCRLSSGGVRLMADSDTGTRDGRALVRYLRYLNAAEYTDYTLYDFPQGTGLYEWSVQKLGAAPPDQLTLSLVETSCDLPGYRAGGLGTLVVKNVPAGKLSATPQRFVNVSEGSKSLDGGVTRDFGAASGNDVSFQLPAGYYTVVSQLGSVFLEAKAQLVPVSAGERTTVRLPESWTVANRALQTRDDDREVTGEITINGTKDRTETAEIALSVSDPKERDVFPTKENTVVTEGGARVELVDIRREKSPCSVALAIDSSGSMRRDMKATLAAATTFVKSLPEGSFVRVVGFAGALRELPGTTAKEAEKALASITAGGSTKLYDATLRCVDAVLGKTRPAVVVFTDGVDSREDKQGTGSANTREQAVKRLRDAKVPVYTIGFGKRLNADEKVTAVDGAPDIGCLTEFAAASRGQYYPAKDPEALRAVFAAIGSKLGNNFVITYRRPTENNVGTTPVVSLVVDNSGSMNTDPKKGAKDCDFRMEKTKQLLRDFVEALPQAAIMQFTTFQGGGAKRVDVNRRQVSTTDKAPLLKAFGEMVADDGTPIVAALTSAYENLLPVPSQKRVIVFLTDSGLEVPKAEQQDYQAVLANIRDKGMFVLWIGMGISSPEKEKLFAEAAKATDGEFVISESRDELAKKLRALLERLQKPGTSQLVPLTVDIACRTAQGEALRYKVQDTAAFSPPQKAGTPQEPDVVAIQTGERATLDDARTTQAVLGAALAGTDNVVAATTELDRSMRNGAMELTLQRAVYLDKLMGVEGRRNNFQFVAVELELKNQTAKKVPYAIPSIFKHFYLGLDGKGLYPASKATWLVERPLTAHGDPSIRIPPGGSCAGTLVFLVPYHADGFVQQSLHFYDTNHGHLQLPMAGAMPPSWLELTKLPLAAPADLADTFALQVTATDLADKLDRFPAGDCSRFRVIEATFVSKVQALLNLDPAQRIFLRFPTAAGDLMCRLSDATAFTPLGFHAPVMLAPGSADPIRLAYDVPAALEGCSSELVFDLAKGSAVFPITAGKKYGAPAPAAEVDGDSVKVRVNQLTQLQKPMTLTDGDGQTKSLFNGSVLLDVTFVDKPGNEGTLIPANFFALVDKSYKPAGQAAAGRLGLGAPVSAKGLLNPSRANDGLVFGLGERFGVFEGQERRAVVIFDYPGPNAADWTLQSPYNPKLQVPVAKGDFASPELLAWQARIPGRDKTFARLLDEAVAAAVKRYAVLDRDPARGPVIRLEPNDGYDALTIPPINTFGLRAMSAVTSVQQFLDLMKTLTCIPKNANGDRATGFDACPESVVTQGFGDVGSTANLAMVLLSRLGRSPRLEALEFTEAGAKAVFEYYGIDVKRERSYPVAVAYDDGSGPRRSFVVPFMRDLSELAGLVYRPRNADRVTGGPACHNADVSVVVVYEPGSDGSLNAAAGDAGSALGGGGGSKTAELVMLQKRLRFDALSRDAIDLAFAPVSAKGKTFYGAVLTTADEVVVGERALENYKRILRVRLELRGLDRPYTHTIELAPEQKLENILVTAGVNLPDLPGAATLALDEAFRSAHAAAQKPEPYTVVRWHHRQILYRFIAGQTSFDREMVQTDKLVLGRVAKPRCLVVSSELSAEGRLTTRVDLLQPFNELHAGDEGLRRAYSWLNGLYQSRLESEVLPAGARVGYLDLWQNAPKDSELLVIPVMSGRPAWRKELQKLGTFPPRLLMAVEENKKVLFVQSKPTAVSGRSRFAWLEADPATYEVLAVLDDGTHGGTAEFSMLTTSLGEDTREFVKGTWLGVNVSVWTVAGVSLKTQDKAQIMMEAKALALKVGGILAEFQDNLEKAKEYYDQANELAEKAGDMQVGGGDAGGEGGDEGGDDDGADPGEKMQEYGGMALDHLPRPKLFGVDVIDKVKEGFRGFSNGYETAVNAYFHFFDGSKKHLEMSPAGSK